MTGRLDISHRKGKLTLCTVDVRDQLEQIASGMIGRTYLERGQPVVVLVRWGKGGGPRNVLIQRGDGERVVRPFRGLRKLPDATEVDAP